MRIETSYEVPYSICKDCSHLAVDEKLCCKHFDLCNNFSENYVILTDLHAALLKSGAL